MSDAKDACRELQEHLDKMPIGYPVTHSGVEINLLKTIFTPEEARVTTHLDYKHRTVDQIFETAKEEVGSKEELTRILDRIVAKGGHFPKNTGEPEAVRCPAPRPVGDLRASTEAAEPEIPSEFRAVYAGRVWPGACRL